MLLTLFISQLFVLAAASPFHKYPYVFLLDVGNEELEKTNTEQIRVSVPGGSLALRYPAAGEGEILSHVRVSGIDFGTDLKANIVDGGPGYKYVVLMFSGNPGVQYDAVVTVQTVPNDSSDLRTSRNEGIFETSDDDDPNDSAEDLNDYPEVQVSAKTIDLSQSSSNIYTEQEDDSDEYINNDVNESISVQNSVDSESDENTLEITDDEAVDENEINEASVPENSVNDDHNEDEENVVFVDKNFYEKYKAFKPDLYDNEKIYLLEPNDPDEREVEIDDSSQGEAVDLEQIFNDEEIHTDAENFKDSNNNYYDSGESSAVAS